MSFRKYQKTSPVKSLVPDLKIRVIATPLSQPCSALVLVSSRNSWTNSGIGPVSSRAFWWVELPARTPSMV